jgi:hypothetical protein
MKHYTLIRILFTTVVVISLNACAKARTQYYWGASNNFSFQYVKDGDSDKYVQSLKKSIDSQKLKRIEVTRPGLYAEYALALLQRGDKNQARYYFELEKSTWPVSTPLMEQLINLTR